MFSASLNVGRITRGFTDLYCRCPSSHVWDAPQLCTLTLVVPIAWAAMSTDPTEPATSHPVNTTPTALPSLTARILGFFAIVISGVIGAFIGYGFTDLQNPSGSTTANAIGALIGATIGAGGVAVVVVLALRAMGEWQSLPRKAIEPKRAATPAAQRPRVR